LYDICATQLGDIEQIARAIGDWAQQNPDRFDQRL
jgi:hypothetical protein